MAYEPEVREGGEEVEEGVELGELSHQLCIHCGLDVDEESAELGEDELRVIAWLESKE